MKAILLSNAKSNLERVYSEEVIEGLVKSAGLSREMFTKNDVLADEKRFADTEYVFSTWGMPVFTGEEIERIFPSLKCVFYSAGTVQAFARPFLERGIKVFSAWAANAVPVAEYTLSQILLANKGFFRTSALMSKGDVKGAREKMNLYRGNFGDTVGIIGAGMIGKLVIKLLKSYNLRVLVFDPFLPDDLAKELCVEKCSLERLFSECSVVSNHLANNKDTVGMLDYHLFSSMRENSTFINTGRGAQVVEDDLVRMLKERTDVIAILDVTCPEPPVEGHPFYSLDNCILTPHIAGSLGDEVVRMSEYMLTEFKRYKSGESCPYEVTEQMLKTMA